MTKGAGTAAELLDLPSGGGSVSGQGGGFCVDLNTGTATASFDLRLPAGPNGVMPPISLRYSAGSGDGVLGMGWSLGLMTIRAAVAATALDPLATGTYSLVGVGPLVAMGAGRYRPVVDGTGLLIESVDGLWSVTDKSDFRCTLGSTTTSRVGGERPVAWFLDRAVDSAGNAVTYDWTTAGGGLLLQTVSWGTYQLVFRYESRPDVVLDGTCGPVITLDQRCNGVELHVVTERQSLVRSWSFGYAAEGRSLLTTIQERGHNADGTVLAAPDQTYGYSAVGAPAMVPITGAAGSLLDSDADLADLSGDGLPDVVQLGRGFPTVRPNLGGGAFGPPRRIGRVPAPMRLSDSAVTFANLSGNGNVDLLVLDRPFSGFYPLAAPGGVAPELGGPTVFRRAPAVVPDDPKVRFVDLNNDGATDVLVESGRTWLMYLRTAAGGWADLPVPLALDRRPPVSLDDPRVHLADMTGDGLTDVVLVGGGGVRYWPGRADGGWGAAVELSPAPVFGPDRDPSRLVVVDVDGDGCADLVHVDGAVTVWRTIGATRLAPPVVVPGVPPGPFRVADVLGTGTAGVLFQLPQRRSGRSGQLFLDLSGGVKPYLLTDLAYGAAASTHVTYRTSTEYARTDAAAGAPWPTYHPFPVQCVARSDQVDHGAGTTASTEYAYHDGRYDPATRTFLGFGRVESEQLGDDDCPTLRVETTFHVGVDPQDPARPLVGEEAFQLAALRRKPLMTATYGLDGSPAAALPYSVATHTYAAAVVFSALPDGDRVAVPYCVSSTEQRVERQTEPVSTRTIDYLDVTTDGDVLVQRTRASRRGVATPDQDVTTTMTLATGGANLRLPARVTQSAPDGTVIAASVTCYDGADFVGLPEGQAVAGLVTRIEDRVFDDAFLGSAWGGDAPDPTRYGYHRLPGDATGWWRTRRAHRRINDPKGPTLVTRGPLGGLQTLTYDGPGQRVVGVTDAAGNTLRAVTDARVHQTASVTDADGLTSTDVFDALGRVTAAIGPLDNAALPSASFTYLHGAVSVAESAARVEHGAPDVVTTTTWIDGSGRTLGKGTPGPASGQRIVSGATVRHVRGVVTTAYLPYAVTGAGWQPPPPGTGAFRSTYDALGRSVSSTRPDGMTVTTRRSGDTVVTAETWPAEAPRDVERQTFDAAGRLVVVGRNAGDHWVEQRYEYAPCGRIDAVTLPDGSRATFDVDLMGRVFAHHNPDSGTTRFFPDACDSERLRVNACGQTVRAEVDVMNRLSAVYHDAETTPRIRYDYLDTGDAPPDDGDVAHRLTRLWRVTDEIGTVRFHYDAAGRTTSAVREVAATGRTYVNAAEFDSLGRVRRATLPAATPDAPGRTVEYGYGPAGQPVRASGVVDDAEYDVFGRLTAIRHTNGASTSIEYAADAGGVERVRVVDAAGSVLRDTTSTRTAGLLVGLTSAVAGDDDVSFGYDGLKRLVAADYVRGTDPPEHHGWSFDDAFTMTSSSDGGTMTYQPGTHRLATVGDVATAFDPAGRRTSGSFGQAGFDAADHLTDLVTADGTHITHTYDYCGLRARSVTGTVQTYSRPVGNIEIRGDTVVTWISFGGRRIAADVGGVLTTLHPNSIGEADLFTDGAGAFVARLARTPFGAPRRGDPGADGSAATLGFLLLGLDASGLVLSGRRWYDPATGQFLSPDPVVTSVFTIGAWSPYLLCLGNPISLADPSGCSFLGVLEVIGVALLATACVVAAIVVPVIGIAGLAVITSNIGFFAGVAVGSLGGALAGELAAQKAGGNIWAGAFVGALMGGATSLAGGALGAAAADGIDGLVGGSAAGIATATVNGTTHTLMGFVASGAIQGTLSGAGTGLATGYAGGKGTAETILKAAAMGAVWGFSLGVLLGVGAGQILGTGLKGTGTPDKYLNILDLPAKFANEADKINSLDNAGGVGQSLFQLEQPGGVNAQNLLGLLPNLVSTGPQTGMLGTYGAISLGPATTFFTGAGFAAAVDLSMAADQAGFSYAHQISLLLGAAPYFIDFAATQEQIVDPREYSKIEKAFNDVYGSASPNDG